MTILVDVFKELFKMFLADLRMTLSILIAIAIIAALIQMAIFGKTVAGVMLLIACLSALAVAVIRDSKSS